MFACSIDLLKSDSTMTESMGYIPEDVDHVYNDGIITDEFKLRLMPGQLHHPALQKLMDAQRPRLARSTDESHAEAERRTQAARRTVDVNYIQKLYDYALKEMEKKRIELQNAESMMRTYEAALKRARDSADDNNEDTKHPRLEARIQSWYIA